MNHVSVSPTDRNGPTICSLLFLNNIISLISRDIQVFKICKLVKTSDDVIKSTIV